MEFLSKILLIATVALSLSSTINGQCPCSGKKATNGLEGKPNTKTATVPTGHFFDTCNSTGTFKSNTICYESVAAATGVEAVYVEPYQYFTCAPYGSSFLLYPRKCNGARVVVPTDNALVESKSVIFNAFNPATGQCDLQPSGKPDSPLATDAAQVAKWPIC